jgi:hypothetical protein
LQHFEGVSAATATTVPIHDALYMVKVENIVAHPAVNAKKRVGIVDIEVLKEDLMSVWSTFLAPDGRADSFEEVESIADRTEIEATVVTSEAMQ